MVAAFSNLLHVRIPNSYEVSSAPDAPSSMGMMVSHRANPAFEYRQHLLLHGPQPGTLGPPGLMAPYGLRQPHVPFPRSGGGEFVCLDYTNGDDFLKLSPREVDLRLQRINGCGRLIFHVSNTKRVFAALVKTHTCERYWERLYLVQWDRSRIIMSDAVPNFCIISRCIETITG